MPYISTTPVTSLVCITRGPSPTYSAYTTSWLALLRVHYVSWLQVRLRHHPWICSPRDDLKMPLVCLGPSGSPQTPTQDTLNTSAMFANASNNDGSKETEVGGPRRRCVTKLMVAGTVAVAGHRLPAIRKIPPQGPTSEAPDQSSHNALTAHGNLPTTCQNLEYTKGYGQTVITCFDVKQLHSSILYIYIYKTYVLHITYQILYIKYYIKCKLYIHITFIFNITYFVFNIRYIQY